LKNFDMVFVFKSYAKKTVMINAVPMNMLDHVKEWLNSCDIRYTEGVQSLNWAKIMKTITDDPEGFFDSGGWSFLDPDSDEENRVDDDSDEEDDQYRPTESESSAEESESEYSDQDSEVEETESENSLATSEESGKDWSELEEEAAAADKTRGDFVDDYTQRKNKGSGHHRDHRDHHRDHHRSKPPPPRKHSNQSSMKNGSHSSSKRSRDESRDKHHKKFRK